MPTVSRPHLCYLVPAVAATQLGAPVSCDMELPFDRDDTLDVAPRQAMRSRAIAVPSAVARSFRGVLVRPGDAGYDEVRQIHNGLIDRRPGLIARCRSASDVTSAGNLARDQQLELSVRGGGHSVAGRSVTDGGLMIDREIGPPTTPT